MNQRKLIPNASGDDDVEGHAFRGKAIDDDKAFRGKATDDDVEGHAFRGKAVDDDSDKAFRGKATEDDVEGHSFLSNPLLNRELASGREQEIRRNLKQRQNSAEAQRPHNKRGRS